MGLPAAGYLTYPTGPPSKQALSLVRLPKSSTFGLALTAVPRGIHDNAHEKFDGGGSKDSIRHIVDELPQN